MGSTIFKNILNSEIENFKRSFSTTSKDLFHDPVKGGLIHPGEYGMYKEKAAMKFLQMIMPQRLSINTGFVITPKDNVSTQCDIIIYDRKSSPLIQNDENQNFYIVETVAGIGEIKSTLSKKDFKTAINKLAKNKMLRRDIADLSPSMVRRDHPGKINLEQYIYDHIFTFIICEKLDFNTNSIDFNELYDDDVEQKYKHNLILSISDGLFLYNEGKNWHYPISLRNIDVRNVVEPPHPKRENFHFEVFAHYFFMGLSSATIFYPETHHYLNPSIKS